MLSKKNCNSLKKSLIFIAILYLILLKLDFKKILPGILHPPPVSLDNFILRVFRFFMTYIHTAESILNLCMHTEPDTAGAEATVQYSILYLAQNPDIYQCIHSTLAVTDFVFIRRFRCHLSHFSQQIF